MLFSSLVLRVLPNPGCERMQPNVILMVESENDAEFFLERIDPPRRPVKSAMVIASIRFS